MPPLNGTAVEGGLREHQVTLATDAGAGGRQGVPDSAGVRLLGGSGPSSTVVDLPCRPATVTLRTAPHWKYTLMVPAAPSRFQLAPLPAAYGKQGSHAAVLPSRCRWLGPTRYRSPNARHRSRDFDQRRGRAAGWHRPDQARSRLAPMPTSSRSRCMVRFGVPFPISQNRARTRKPLQTWES